MLRHLTSEEMRETLQRASEIARSQSPLAEPTAEEELESYLSAAEEAGIPRDALLQALRERHLAPIADLTPGKSVFAPSADDTLHVAEILRVDGATAHVRFSSGGEHTVAVADLRPLSLVPGLKVQCLWKYEMGMGEGWENAEVVRFDPKSGRVQVNTTWLGTREVPLKRLRLVPRAVPAQARMHHLLWKVALAGGAFGGALGLLLGKLLL